MTDALADLQRALAPAYRLERKRGGGGTARVLVATELALGREVVIKCIAEDDGSTASRQRFVRDFATAARLQPPNIVPPLTAGVADTLLGTRCRSSADVACAIA
ncbi:MAG: hypothetical protein ACOVSI_00520 [Gemmatimonas sp.]